MINRFEQFASSIACIYRYIQKLERDEMAKYGLKGPHAMCLVILSRYEEGITATELCKICDKDKAAISRTIAQLNKMGLVEKTFNNNVNYRTKLTLSEKGLEISNKVNDIVTAAVEQAGAGLSDEDRKIFYYAMDLIAGNLHTLSSNGIEGWDD